MGISIVFIIFCIGFFWFLKKHPGAFRRIVILCVVIATYFNVALIFEKSTVSLSDLLLALFQPIFFVLLVGYLVQWIRTGKLNLTK